MLGMPEYDFASTLLEMDLDLFSIFFSVLLTIGDLEIVPR